MAWLLKAGAKVLHFFEIRKYFMKKSAIIVIFLALALGINAQTHTRVYDERIRTLRVARAFLSLNAPLDGSDPENTLEISFDEMSHDVHFYAYTVQHMNADRTAPSELLSGEYLRGFTNQDIMDYEHSINTNREYTHYRFTFPNADMALTRSGNYQIIIYEDGNRDKCVAEVDFCVVEPMVKIDGGVRSNTDIEFNGRYQQLDIDVNTTNINLKDPNEIRVLVTQNNRTDNAVWLQRPTYLAQNHLKFQQMRDLIFEGGNEYRHFDAFSRFYSGTGIDRVFYELGDYQVMLFPDEIMTGEYVHHFDANGAYLINAEHTIDSDTEAEYMWVHWMLPVARPWLDGSLYVGGELFGNEMNLRNRMQYDAEAQCYWLTALVKQGGYDYQYWFVPTESRVKSQESRITTTQRVDGSYWQTENEYLVYVYWRPFGARYDRLIGVTLIH